MRWLRKQLMRILTLICLLPGQGVYYGIANECMNKMKEMGIVNLRHIIV